MDRDDVIRMVHEAGMGMPIGTESLLVGHDLREPVSTITQSGSHQQLCTAEVGQRQPMVRAWLAKYYGTAVGQSVADPLHSTTTKARFGLVTVLDDIADIGMRMLAPRELFRAQGFDECYQIDPVVDGRPLPKAAQVRLCGNSVCPPLAEALVAANMATVDAGRIHARRM